MPLPFRRRIRPEFVTPPQEPHMSRAAALEGVNIRLSELSGIPHAERTPEYWAELDRLLERHTRLAGLLAGRAEASIENYQENPW